MIIVMCFCCGRGVCFSKNLFYGTAICMVYACGGLSGDVGKMANSPQKVQVTASLINTSRGIKVYEGDDIIQSLKLKQGGRGGIG